MNTGIRIVGLFALTILFATNSGAVTGDGMFTPITSPVAPIDKTDRPMTVDVRVTEPSFAGTIAAGKPTGDSYVIHFPTSDAGGDCIYNGNARYMIESTGALNLEIIANCGNLMRGYSYHICMLNQDLRCGEAPWWNFRGETFSITEDGVAVNHGAVIPWKDPADAPRKLQKMAASMKRLHDLANGPNTMRMISCREFRPESKSFMLHELPLGCMIQSACSGMPNTDSLRDGDVIDWNSPAGDFARQQLKVADVSNWVCWMRAQ